MINKNDYQYINLEFIYDLADGEDEFIVEIIGDCIGTVGPNLQKLDDAIKKGDVKTTEFLAHKLTGSFNFIGCNEVAKIVGQIEEMMKRNDAIAEAMPLCTAVSEQYKSIEQELILLVKEISA